MKIPFTGGKVNSKLKVVFVLVLSLLFVETMVFADIPEQIYTHHAIPVVSVFDMLCLSDEPLGDFKTLTIPLKRAGKLFLIEAKIDGQVGNLIFDTGASGLVLNRTYFRKYAGIEKASGGGITGASDKIYSIVINRIDISGLYYQNIAADLTDLGHIENRRGVKVLGLFGLNMITNFEVIFDANKNELELNRIDKQGNRLSFQSPELKYDFTQSMETGSNIMLIKGKIGDKVLSFCLDTGAECNVISSSVSKKVMNTIQINRRSDMKGSGSASVEVLYGTMKEFEFGSHQFGSMETVVASLCDINDAYGCNIDGLLGYDFWQKGIFCFNFRKNEISFSLWKGDKK